MIPAPITEPTSPPRPPPIGVPPSTTAARATSANERPRLGSALWARVATAIPATAAKRPPSPEAMTRTAATSTPAEKAARSLAPTARRVRR